MGVLDQVKQAMQMRKEAKRVQEMINKISVKHSNGGITCVVRGDFSVLSIKIEEEALQEVLAGKPERFETMLLNVVNGAIGGAKKQAQDVMQKMMMDSGKGGMLG